MSTGEPETPTQAECLKLWAERNPRRDRESLGQQLERDINNGLPVNADGSITVLDALRWNLAEWSRG